MKKAFTLVELLVVIAIVGILAMLLVPAIHYAIALKNAKVEVFQCVKTYTLTETHGFDEDKRISTVLKVNLHRLKSDQVLVFTVEEETVYAQFESGKYYEVVYYKVFDNNFIKSAKILANTVAENGESTN
jgi:prepilin-type N-terminal cleavage/methylation domain-containing protein